MKFEIFETTDQHGMLAGVMLISNGKVVNIFPSVALAVAYLKYEFKIGIRRVKQPPWKRARLVFERRGHRVIELDDGVEPYCIVIDPGGNVVPRNFAREEAVEFLQAKLAVKFGERR